VARASSRSGRYGSGTHSSSRTKVCSASMFGAIQRTARWLAYHNRWYPRWPAVPMPLSATTAMHWARVSRPPPASAAPSTSTARSATCSLSPRNARRFAAPANARLPIRSSIQCTSRGGTKCTVPRIGQVRTASRRSSAAVTSPSVNRGSRTPNDHSPLARSCACMAPIQVTTPATSAARPPGRSRSSRLAIRMASACRRVNSTTTAS
jgi:hypothetical protein